MSLFLLAATSDIAQQSARRFAQRGERLILAGRNAVALEKLVTELCSETGMAPSCFQTLQYSAENDLADAENAEAFWNRCAEISNATWNEPIHGVYIAQGFLPSQDPTARAREISTCVFLNLTSVANFLEAVAARFEQEGETRSKRWIAVIVSVAGDRGRYSNYPYGAAKAGLDAFLSGLRARLSHCGVHVLTVKPGLVQTRMIQGRPQAKSATAASPQRVARDIDRAIWWRKNTLYTPSYWYWIMTIVRWIPEWIFKRMRF